jgi:hypothetical protein
MLGAAAARLRRSVGPAAWVVLEALGERAEADDGRTMSRCSVRGLAAAVGLANDTVARALRRLDAAGLLHHECDRASTGRFSSGRYVLTLPADVFDLAAHPERVTPTLTSNKRQAERSPGQQLALLTED